MTHHISEAHITSDPDILAGKSVIAGTRISVQLILEKMRDGWTIADLLDDYPRLTREQVEAALDYAAEAMGATANDNRPDTGSLRSSRVWRCSSYTTA